MKAKINQSGKTFKEMRIMEAEFQMRMDRLDKMTEDLECRVDRMGKGMSGKISGRM